jgi:hypothetical protein
LAPIWLAPPPRKGRVAFCDGGATTPRTSEVGPAVCAAAGAPPRTAEIIDPVRMADGKTRIARAMPGMATEQPRQPLLTKSFAPAGDKRVVVT